MLILPLAYGIRLYGFRTRIRKNADKMDFVGEKFAYVEKKYYLCSVKRKNEVIMLKQKIQAAIPFAAKGTLTAMLELYRFEENGIHIAYCPSLDLSAAGQTFAEATKEFEGVFLMHMEDCVSSGTLHEDLIAHGWKMTSTAFNAPKATTIISRNPALRDIVNNHSYRKELRSCKLPRTVSQAMAAI